MQELIRKFSRRDKEIEKERGREVYAQALLARILLPRLVSISRGVSAVKVSA